MKVENHRGHTVLAPRYGTASPIVIDGGAHKGEFARSVTDAWGARVHAFEPNPHLFAALNLPSQARGYEAAVSDTDGRATFFISDNLEASSLGAPSGTAGERIDVKVMSLPHFIEDTLAETDIFLIKLDVEGAEVRVIPALSSDMLARIEQISVEFHDFFASVTEEDVAAAISHLEANGFVALNFAIRSRGDVLFVNQRLRPLSVLQQWRLRHVQRYWMRVRRGGLGRAAANLLAGRSL